MHRSFPHALRLLGAVTVFLAIAIASPAGNQLPTDIVLSNQSVPENRPIGTTVGILTAVDQDVQSAHVFSLAEGDGDQGNGAFTIESGLLKTAAVLDHQLQDSYSVRIRATDTDDLFVERVFNLTVIASPPPAPVPGGLDPFFEPDLPLNNTVTSVALQRDNGWLIGGYFTSVQGLPRGRIARLHPNGTIDESFLNGLAGANDVVQTLVEQDDGRILVGGAFTSINGTTRNRIARLHPDGTLDETFAAGLAGPNGRVNALLVQSDGKILMGGEFTAVNGQPRTLIARLNTDGTLDETFSVSLDFNFGWPGVTSIAKDAEGKIFIGGFFTEVNGFPLRCIARLNADGTRDLTFLNVYRMSTNGASSTVRSIVVQSDGRILIGGDFNTVNGIIRRGIARLELDGEVDETFGEGLAGADDGVRSVILQESGKILLVGGFTTVNNQPRNRVARLHEDGTLDSSFGEGMNGASSWVNSMALRSDATLLIGGQFTFVNALPRPRIALLFAGEFPEHRAATDLLLSNRSVVEGRPAGTLVGSLNAIDPDDGDSHAFELVAGEGGEDNGSFSIEANELRTATVFDHAFRSSYSIRVRATDGAGLWVERTFTVTVEPDLSPTDILLKGDWVVEGQPAGIPVGTLSAADPDSNETHLFSLVSGEGDDSNHFFAIEGTTLTTATAPDQGTEGLHTVRIRATNTQGWYLERTFSLTVWPAQPVGWHPGSVDRTFEPGGSIDGAVRAVARQSDGGWIIGGEFTTIDGNARGGVARFNADGSLDFGFGDGAAGANGGIHSIALQEDGKILIGGDFSAVHGQPRNSVARLLQDGTLDTVFVDPLVNPGAFVQTIAVLANGQILIGGDFTSIGGEARDNIARLNTDGSLDSSFENGLSGIHNAIRSIAVQTDGKIITGGTFLNPYGHSQGRLARMEANGSLDVDFQLGQFDGPVHHVVLQPDGKAMVGGSFSDWNGAFRYHVARFLTDGELDSSFEADIHEATAVHSLAVQSDGKLLIGGTFNKLFGVPRNGIARLDTNGALDSTFGAGVPGANGSVFAMALDEENGKLFIGGDFTAVNGIARDRVALLYGDAPPNRAPTDVLSSSSSVAEFRPAGTFIGTLTATDPDDFDTHTFNLVSGEGAEDNLFFTIDGDQLLTAEVFDYQVQNSYSIRVRATDAAGLFVGRAISIAVEPRAPTDIFLSNDTVLQNQPAGTVVGILTAVDPVPEETHVFTLVDGEGDEGNASFAIEGDALKTAAVFDHETQSSYSIRIRATDTDGLFVEKIFVIEVEPNHAPTDILLSDSIVPANWPAGTAVGTLTAIDPDDDTHTIALVPGDGDEGNPFFALDGDILRTAAVFDQEVQETWSIRVRATDPGGFSVERSLTLTVESTHPIPAPGVLDFSFATGAVNDVVRAVARQPDGKWIIAGQFTSVHGQTRGRVARLNADGTLDTSFLASLSGANGTVYDVAVQEDGKILIGGDFTSVNGTTRNRIARLNPNGSLDTTFAGGSSGANSGVRAIRVQEDGRILIGGNFTSVDDDTRFRVARLHADGALDGSFSSQVGDTNDYVNSIGCQEDGDIVIGGRFLQVDGESRSHLARLTSDGSLDPVFVPEITGSFLEDIALQPDGKILIGGGFSAVNGNPRNNIARLNADGTTDLTFGQGMTGLNSWALALALMPNGKITVGGFFTSANGTTRNRIARLHPDGSLDSTFGFGQSGANAGVLSIALQPDDETLLIGGFFTSVNGQTRQRVALLHNGEAPPNQAPTDILLSRSWLLDSAPAGSTVGILTAVDPDEGDTHTFTLVAGSGDSGNPYFTIDGDDLKTAATFDHPTETTYSIRIQATDAEGLFVKKTLTITIAPDWGDAPGAVDLTFDAGAINGPVHSIARQSDGKWIIAGGFTTVGGQQRGNIARLNSDGSLDRSFGEGMLLASRTVSAVAVQEDGKILIAGSFTSVNGVARSRFARLNPDGSLDEDFYITLSGGRGFITSFALQKDQRILIWGDFTSLNGEPHYRVARLHPDGSLDESFSFSHDIAIGAAALQSDGKIVVVGWYQRPEGGTTYKASRLHADGTVDESFTEPWLIGGDIHTTEVQDDGKILLGGSFTSVYYPNAPASTPRRRIARLNPDGTLDTSFGHGLSGAQGGLSPRVVSIAIQPSGKILIGGEFTSVNDQPRNRIALLNPDGSLDDTFGAGMSGANAVVYAVAARGLDVLMGGAFTMVNGIPRDRIARLQGGNLPPTAILLSETVFADNQAIGTIVGRFAALDGNEDDLHTFTFVPGGGDGGNAFFATNGNTLRTAALIDHEETEAFTIRVRATDLTGAFVERVFPLTVEASPQPAPPPGAVDLSFDPGISIDGAVRAAVVEDNGKILIGGDFTSIDGETRRGIARLRANGTVDTLFAEGLAGISGDASRIDSMAVQKDGGILIGGWFTNIHGEPRGWLARLHPDGTLDSNFPAGQSGPLGPVHSIALQSDGRILIGGQFTTVNGVTRNRLARLNADGTLDTSFGHGLAGASSTVESIAVASDGKILIGGQFTSVNSTTRNRIARLHADGTLDDTFGQGLAGASWMVHSVVLQDDGKVLIGGAFSSVNNVSRDRIARLHPDGTLDTAFNPYSGAEVFSIALQADAKILVGSASRMRRLNTDGNFDITSMSAGTSGSVFSLTLLDDGKILIGGGFSSVNGVPRNRIARLHGGSPPPPGIGLSSRSVREREPIGTTIGTMTANNPALGLTHVFTLMDGEGGEDNASFTIDDDTLKTAAVFDRVIQDSYAIRIRAANTQGRWVKRTFTITVDPNPYARWAEALPEGEREPVDDPGGHGIVNLLRYAFGMDALQPGREKLPRVGQVIVTEDGQPQTYLTLTYTRRTDDGTLLYIVEVSPDLEEWSLLEGADEIVSDGAGETETVTVIDTRTVGENEKRFLRSRVER